MSEAPFDEFIQRSIDLQRRPQSGIAQPIMPFPSDQEIAVDYYYLTTKLDGLLSFTDTWTWEVNANYSRSKGEYDVPEGLISSFPVTTSGGDWSIVEGLEIDDFSRARIDASTAELADERAAVTELGLI